ncbi:nuclear transport factor 2 family protein [Actinoplanes sp. DH11]|uniref:nuclear transport factor 2 family protein n=1 Tax=Actinoplanes sp. DH11 TaxID=2857011 RepID=UPI001E35A27C|nr:nuclear transport factor 2 family protein [Actinoplanes sp. DH11]
MEELLPAVDRWRAAGEARDAAGAVAALSADVVLFSPITEQFAFRGREQVRDLLEVALAAIDEITYTDQVAEGRTVALFYRARVGGTPLHEAQRLRLDADGLITEITLYIRPLPALTRLMTRLGPELARRNGQPALARLIPVAGGMLHAMADSGDRTMMPRAAPRPREAGQPGPPPGDR